MTLELSEPALDDPPALASRLDHDWRAVMLWRFSVVDMKDTLSSRPSRPSRSWSVLQRTIEKTTLREKDHPVGFAPDHAGLLPIHQNDKMDGLTPPDD